MSLNQHFKKWSWLFGIAGFSLMVAAIFVLPQYLKPDLDAGVTFYATEGCAPFKGQCIGRKDNQAITVGLGNEAIESMTEIPIRVHLANMTADSLIVDFEGLEMYMGVVRTQLVPNAQASTREPLPCRSAVQAKCYGARGPLSTRALPRKASNLISGRLDALAAIGG